MTEQQYKRLLNLIDDYRNSYHWYCLNDNPILEEKKYKDYLLAHAKMRSLIDEIRGLN